MLTQGGCNVRKTPDPEIDGVSVLFDGYKNIIPV